MGNELDNKEIYEFGTQLGNLVWEIIKEKGLYRKEVTEYADHLGMTVSKATAVLEHENPALLEAINTNARDDEAHDMLQGLGILYTQNPYVRCVLHVLTESLISPLERERRTLVAALNNTAENK